LAVDRRKPSGWPHCKALCALYQVQRFDVVQHQLHYSGLAPRLVWVPAERNNDTVAAYRDVAFRLVEQITFFIFSATIGGK
jgi:hypothetical protein